MGTVRFLLALCVVVTHSPGSALLGFPLLNGITAVQCFYVISGFLITMVLNERPEYQNPRNFYLAHLYCRRPAVADLLQSRANVRATAGASRLARLRLRGIFNPHPVLSGLVPVCPLR
jgi:hypothetical protein